MTKEQYVSLYKKYLSGTASPSEIELITCYEDQFDLAKFDTDEDIYDQGLIKKRIYATIQDQIVENPHIKRFPKFWWSVAASLLLLSSIGFYFLKDHSHIQGSKISTSALSSPLIQPGTSKAILILGNGKQLDLDQTTNGQIAQVGQVSITKLKDGQLVYGKKNSEDSNQTPPSFNSIITPRGGQYQILLPDGTAVWLNSASSLRYPTSFAGRERHVELSGEAYFEVAKNKAMPFTVTAGKVKVNVLGTHFNISAYEDELSSKTTLLEGAVNLIKDDQQLTLRPGQQVISANGSPKLITKAVNTDDAVAWKNGYFSFRRESLGSAMRKIARWYDVELIYQGKVSDKMLGGSVLRTESITEVLKTLELTGIAKFNIEGRRIMIKAN